MTSNRLKSVLRQAILVVSASALCATVAAQTSTELPTRGKRFWTTYMQNGFGAQFLRIHIASSNATSGTVSIPLLGWNQPFTVGANSVAIVDVPTSAELTGTETVQGRGVLVQALDSVNVHMASFQNYTHDLSQVLPEQALGTLYRVDAHHGLPNFNNLHKSEFAVLAIEDGTQVRITPSANTAGGHAAGIPYIINLNAGEAYQVQAATDQLNLTGTLIEATAQSGPCRPFVVLGGSMCGTSPNGCSACDHIFEQCLPITAWGTRYHTVQVQGASSVTYRVMAHQDNTLVTIGGGAPILLNAGQRHEVNGATAAVCIEASLPVSVAQVLEGYSCAGNGDPSLLLLSPEERVSRSALYATSNSAQVNQHSVSLVVPTTAVNQVQIDGVPVNPALFQPYSACANRSHAKVPVAAGTHRITCAAGFQAYALGIGFGESYAFSVNDIAYQSIPEDSIVCGTGTITLNSPEPLNNAEWVAMSDPYTVIGIGNSITITPTQTEAYRVSGLLPVSGCPREFTYNVGMPLTIPTLLTANGLPSINVCQYEPVQLALVPPPDPAWFSIDWWPAYSLNDPGSSAPVASPMATTWYGVHVESPAGCGTLTDSILVSVQPGAIIDLQASAQPATICLGNTTQLSSSVLRREAGDAFDATPSSLWTAIQGGTISQACGSVSGSALYFNGNGQRSAQTAAVSTIGGGFVRFKLKIANGTTPCDDAEPGDDVVLEYSNNNGLNWSVLATFNETLFASFGPIDVPIPAVAQTAGTMFRVRQLANQGAGHDNWAIDDFLIARYDNAFASYAWSQPGTLNDPYTPAPIATPTATDWYVLSLTDPTAGCEYSDSVMVNVAPAFSLSVSPSTTSCSISGIPLEATPSSGSNIAYAWSPNNGTLSNASVANPTATPTQTTTYSVTATSGDGCVDTGQTTITVGQLFDLDVSAAQSAVCPGQSAQLTATLNGAGGVIYSWSGAGLNDAGIADPVATPVQTTTYICTVTDPSSNCQLVDSVTVMVNSGYGADAGLDATVCSTLGYQLTVQHNVPGATYSWSPAANLNSSIIQSPTIMVEATATYTVTVTDAIGCTVSDQVTITRAFAGVPSVQTASACADAPPTLNAPATGVSYQWSTGEVTASIIPAQSGPYTVTISDANGCQAISTFNVTLHALPLVDLGPDLSICGASPQLLDAGNPGSSYQWSTGAQTQTISAAASGIYSVTVTNASDCSASDAVTVQFNALPIDLLQDATACATSPPVLDASNPGSTYLWSTGAVAQTIVATSGGTYSVAVTTPDGCTSTFDAEVTLAPPISVELGNDTTICQGQPITLDAGNSGASFMWSTGAQTQTVSTGQSGNYSVTVSNGPCSASDAIAIDVAGSPVDALVDVTRCTGETALLDAGNPGCSYSWSTGATTQSISVGAGGNYSVVITNAAGCSGTFSAEAVFIAPPTVELGNDTVLCEGQRLHVDAGNPGSTYQWSNGAVSRAIQIAQPGSYSVTVNNGVCSRSDAIVVQFNPSPARMAVNEFHTCLDDEPKYVVINAGNPGSSYQWSTGESTPVIMAGAYGWYYVHMTNIYDCSLLDSAQVIEYCPATIFVPNTFTPNGDGVNDLFVPMGKSIATMRMTIHDRWGELLYEMNDLETGWDGTYRGEPVKSDVYVWRMEYTFYIDKEGTEGVLQSQMGHIQVLR